MYESPIKIIQGQLQTQMDNDILRAVQSYNILVDKGELTRALQYDREQYDRGYADGYMNAQQELVRCKDCWKSAEGLCGYQLKNVPGKDFCGDGERLVE